MEMDQEPYIDTSITKINIDGQHIYVKMLWEDNVNDLFCVKIFDGSKTWSGKFATEFVETCRSLLDESEDMYKLNVKKAFSDDHEEFVYEFAVSPDNKTAQFSWKIAFEDATVMVHGSLPVHLDDEAESKDTLIDYLLNENKELKEAIEMFNRRNEALTENLDKCKKEMEEFVNMKTQLETSLYGKFVQLLNEKKKRIRLLEENLQKFE